MVIRSDSNFLEPKSVLHKKLDLSPLGIIRAFWCFEITAQVIRSATALATFDFAWILGWIYVKVALEGFSARKTYK